MQRYRTKRTRDLGNGVIVFGATEPVMTVLDVAGFELRDMFLMGLSDSFGSIIVEGEGRAGELAAKLEPSYRTDIHPARPGTGDWVVNYTQRNLDGSEGGIFRKIVMKDGTVVMENGRWI